jgi:hypothetical protein
VPRDKLGEGLGGVMNNDVLSDVSKDELENPKRKV